MKNAQQNTSRKASHENIRLTHLAGQVVTVCRIYQRRKDQTYWDITLPDGSRAFVPDSWTESIGNHPSTGSQELALSALRNLGTINAELQDRVCAERSSSGAIASKFGCVGGRAVAHP